MKYELMIHGKPNAGSFNVSSGIEPDFANMLNDEFFCSMGSFKGQEMLIVDARFWKGVWYSIYTYWFSNNVRGIDDRDSYIAISVIVPKSYYMFNSGVYERLKDLLNQYVIGTYVSKTGEYLVKDFSQEREYFSKLISAFGRNFSNLEEDFDNQFNSNNQTNVSICYNPLDCDSKAFIKDLKSTGRVYISDKYPTKDQKSVLADQYRIELEKSKRMVSAQVKEISQLKQTVNSLQQTLDNNQRVGNNKYGELKNEHTTLQQRYAALAEKLNKVQESFGSLLDKVQNLSTLLDAKRQKSVHVERHDIAHEVKQDAAKVKKISLRRFLSLPLLNTFLILLFGILLLVRFNSSNEGGNAKTDKKMGGIEKTVASDDTTNVENQVEDTNDGQHTDAEVLSTDQTQQVAATTSDYSETTSAKDKNCNLKLQSGDNSGDNVHPFYKLKYDKQNGYNFYFDNIKNADAVRAAIQDGKDFSIDKVKKEKATIIYRSENRKNLNKKNIVIIE